jgi:hypothetical protein
VDTVAKIYVDLSQEKAWDLEKKDDERNLFCYLLGAGMHQGGQIFGRKTSGSGLPVNRAQVGVA